MILVVGGLASGKRTFARSLGFALDDMACDVHERVTDEQDVAELAEQLTSYSVVTCAEVGSGVVPLQLADRAWRDAVGHLARLLAQRSSAVVRMVCGVPVVLQGSLPAAAAPACIDVLMVRHGKTPGNALRRYVGVLDEPLSEEGVQQAQDAPSYPQVARVYVSRLKRTHETAALMFPHAQQEVVPGIEEMDFGDFAGRSADDMEHDTAYRAWVEGNCEGQCPGGEARAAFTNRVCAAFEQMVRTAAVNGERSIVVVAHGGTMMATLSRFAHDDTRSYFEWSTGNCQGYRMRVHLKPTTLEITDITPA